MRRLATRGAASERLTAPQLCYVPVLGRPGEVPVVQDAKFDVLDLPEMLPKGLKDGTDFVQIDLFCIPQDRSPLSRKLADKHPYPKTSQLSRVAE